MSRYYYTSHLLNADGTPNSVELGQSISEKTAARVALQASNHFVADTCVVEHDTQKNRQKIVQRITYHIH